MKAKITESNEGQYKNGEISYLLVNHLNHLRLVRRLVGLGGTAGGAAGEGGTLIKGKAIRPH